MIPIDQYILEHYSDTLGEAIASVIFNLTEVSARSLQ